MRWSDVIAKYIALLRADAEISGLISGNIFRASSSVEIRFPSLTYFVVSDRYNDEDLHERILVQWDIWAKKASEAAQLEKAMFRLMDSRTRYVTLAPGLVCMTTCESSADLDDDEPGVSHRAVTYRVSVVKD